MGYETTMDDPAFESLRSERLVLRRFRAGDAESLARYRSDPEVARYQAWECPYPLAAARDFIESLAGRAPGEPGAWFQFAVCLTSNGPPIGDCALCCRDGEPRQAELGFTFARAYQGRGYASEAVRCLLRYAFDTLSLHRVFALTDARNRPAQRLLERVGFRREGHLVENTWFKGEWASELLYAQLEREWRQGQGA
jgi:RimJ/RimL family protein N-acetyltransferase